MSLRIVKAATPAAKFKAQNAHPGATMSYRRRPLFLSAVVCLCLLNQSATAADCPCGPLYCLNDPALPKVLADKKAALKKEGYPDRLIALLDRQGQCHACITNAPDGFSILLVYTRDDRIEVVPWDADAERIANEQLASKEIKEYLLISSRRVCSCCEQPAYDKRKDYDPVVDVNRDAAISCKQDAATGKVNCN